MRVPLEPLICCSRRRVLTNNPSDTLLVLDTILLEEIVGLRLGWRFRVWVVEQVLHAQKDLLDCDGRLPRLLLVQD